MADDTRVAAVDGFRPPGQTAPAPLIAPVPPTADQPAHAETTPLEKRRAIPSSGRGLIGHTALTVPAGSVEVSMRSVVPYAGLATISAGIRSTTELSAELGGVLEGEDPVAVFGAGVKQVLVRGDRVQVSVGGTIRRLRDPEAESVTIGQFGGTVSACADRRCSLLFSSGLSVMYTSEVDSMRPVISLGISAGSLNTRFLGEVFVVERAAAVFGGVRFGNAKFTGDVGLMTMVLDEFGVLPFAGFSTRM